MVFLEKDVYFFLANKYFEEDFSFVGETFSLRNISTKFFNVILINTTYLYSIPFTYFQMKLKYTMDFVFMCK